MKRLLLALVLMATPAWADDITRTCTTEDIPNGTKTTCVYVVPMPSLTLTTTTTCTVTMVEGKYTSACDVDQKVKILAVPAVPS